MENPFNLPPEMVADVVVDAPLSDVCVASNTDVAPTVVGFDPRKRLRALLCIPERDRTDEQWDEIIELEIQLAPGNRVDGTQPNNKARHNNAHNARQNSMAQNNAGNSPNAKKRPRANNFRRMRNKQGNNPGNAPSF